MSVFIYKGSNCIGGPKAIRCYVSREEGRICGDISGINRNVNHRMDMRGFSGYEEMNAYMIRQWNDHVTKKDEVNILGDFAISRGRAANEILRQLNGKKYLIEGNHG